MDSQCQRQHLTSRMDSENQVSAQTTLIGRSLPLIHSFTHLKKKNKKLLLTTMLDTILDAAAAAKSLQSCLTLCDPIDGSPSGSAVPGILQARTLEWGAIAFSNA